MFNRILRFSIDNRYAVLAVTALVALVGVVSYHRLIIDAVPDITNVQVQVNTEAPGYSPYEVEQRVTQPIELLLAGMPALEYTRSLSRYGLSQVTAVFKDGTDIYFARQLVAQRLQESQGRIPANTTPHMGPITTGLGEIFQFIVENSANARQPRTLQELREIQDWVIRPQLKSVQGVVDVNSIGGASKQIVVGPDIEKLRAFGVTLHDISFAIAANNTNVGAGFVEQNGEQFLVRVPSQVRRPEQLEDVVVGVHEGTPIQLRHVARVEIGSELRAGAATENGKEVVLGTVFMLVGENGRAVAERVSTKLREIARSVPDGVLVKPVYSRANLVNAAIATVRRNLCEGALLVTAILFLALGNLRAACITACVIPLSMTMTIFGMVQGKLSANLMSLGALDFGLIVDGAVILVENCVKRLRDAQLRLGRPLKESERLDIVYTASSEVRHATMFGELIIMVVYVPILTLAGIEGKMFHPMAFTVLLALGAAFVFSLTFVPAAVATFLKAPVREHAGAFEKLGLKYQALLVRLLAVPRTVVAASLGIFICSVLLFTRLGSEFIPSLDEGDIAMHALRIPGTSLTQAIGMQHQLERAFEAVPEIKEVFAKLGTAEIATDPMPPSVADAYVMLKPRSEWPNPKKPKAQVVAAVEQLAYGIPGSTYEFTQPIQMRFNELIAGVRADVAVKVFGDDMAVLSERAERIEKILGGIGGAADVKVEQVSGLPMVSIEPKRAILARWGLQAAEVQQVVRTAYAGDEVSRFYQGDRNFPIVVRLADADRNNLAAIAELPVPLPSIGPNNSTGISGERASLKSETPDKPYVTLREVAEIVAVEGPNQISRENGKRRVVVTANVRNRDLGSFVQEAQERISNEVKLPAGYWLGWGGQYEHLLAAERRLLIVVPIVLLSVFLLIQVTLRSLTYSLVVYSAIPFALSGGICALWLRGIPFSISAAVGFIALSGVAVLNGLVLVSFTRRLLDEGQDHYTAIVEGAVARIRPVLMTALVASLGFIPMAISQGTGSEVQRPLATVVIGGILSSTALTLLVLPVLLHFVGRPARALSHPSSDDERSK
jgi:cobalt-zinc-cadmium resistance protein CzcA